MPMLHVPTVMDLSLALASNVFPVCAAGTDNRDANAFCTDDICSFSCASDDGHDDDGVTCVDINECDGDNVFSATGVCQILAGSYDCSCKSGFAGDGFDAFESQLSVPAIEVISSIA